MESEELQAMRNQIHRLNTILEQYQLKYPPIRAKTRALDLPWLTDKNLMSPLLEEYDANIHALKEQNENYRATHQELRLQVDKLVAENKRLSRDLKITVESQISELPTAGPPESTTLEENQLVANLQLQLQMALQEKDFAMETWQAAVREVERLEETAKRTAFNPRMETLEAHAAKVREQYKKTVSELTREVEVLSDELHRSKNELKAANIQVMELRHTLQEMKNQLVRKVEEKNLVEGREKHTDNKADELTKTILCLEGKLQDSEMRMESFRREKGSLEKNILVFQKKCAELEQREYEAVLQVKESVQMVENAMLEKDEALVRERQNSEEILRLQDAIAKLLDEAGARTRVEVDVVKKQCNENITRLMEEIHSLELENSERQGQIDRAMREKRAVESELEKIYQEGLTAGTKEARTIDDLNSRACHAERLRDEAMTKIDSVTAQLRRLEMKYNEECKQHKAETNSLRERLEQLGLEFETANADRVRLVAEVDELKKKSQALSQERDCSQRNSNKEMILLERDSKRKMLNYETRLQVAEDGHRHAMQEMRTLLNSLQRMSAKWKEECQTITAKFEVKVQDLRTEITRQKKRNDELSKLVKESREKTVNAEEMICEYARNLRRMEERVKEAENFAATAVQQVHQQMARTRTGLGTSQAGLGGSMKLTTGNSAEPMTLQDLKTEPRPGPYFTDYPSNDR